MAEKAGTKQDKAAAATEEKKTRNVLTAAQRIEKARADLAELEAKEQAKAKAKVTATETELAALTKRRDDLTAKVEAKQEELDVLRDMAGITPAEAPQA